MYEIRKEITCRRRKDLRQGREREEENKKGKEWRLRRNTRKPRRN